MRSIYLRCLLEDLYKKKIVVTIFLLCSILCFAALGYKKAIPELNLTLQEKEDINEYEERLLQYDDTIKDVKDSIILVDQQIEPLQAYIDHSIFMKINPQNIQTASVQYSVQETENVGNILSSLTMYINEGGIREALSEEYNNLEPEYWREIVSCSSTGNIFNVTVIHYDPNSAEEILTVIKKRLQEQIKKIAEIQGNFSLIEMDSAYYTKSDINIANSQNGNRNNLKNYKTNRTDLNNKLISQQNGKSSYIEKNKPEALPDQSVNPTVNAVKFAVAGALLGLVLPCVFFLLQYILGNRIRSVRDLEEYHIPVLNSVRPNGTYTHTLDRSLLDIKMILQQKKQSSLYLNGLTESAGLQKVISDYTILLESTDVSFSSGFNISENAEALEQMICQKSCILFLQAGKNTYPQLEQQINLCRAFNINLLGCIVIQ